MTDKNMHTKSADMIENRSGDQMITDNDRTDLFATERAAAAAPGIQIDKNGIVFSVSAATREPVTLILYEKASGTIAAELPFPECGYSGALRSMKVIGVKPDHYEYNYRIGNSIVTDPCARLIAGRDRFGERSGESGHSIRGAFPAGRFDWKGDTGAPELPYHESIMYQLHVRGFTMDRHSKVRHKGTFLGLQEKIPYLEELGVTTVVLMPAYDFDEIMEERLQGSAYNGNGDPVYRGNGGHTDKERTASLNPGDSRNGSDTVLTTKRLNYWGFGKAFYYAPKHSYAATSRPDTEFKTMVRSFHEHGMEVIMKFHFPDPVDSLMVNDCLTWWVREYHIDGFVLLMNSEYVIQAAGNPALMRTKLICEGLDSSRVYGKTTLGLPKVLAECNDGFLINARKLLKGDEDQLSGFAMRMRRNPAAHAVINYMTDHAGFTLMDLVSYDKKHNEANGEDGRDGTDYNYSWNCGAEGITRKRSIQAFRLRQIKNAFAMMLLSQGTPMLLAGDEFGNSQMGNNNPYCHDSELTWTDWGKEKSCRELTAFVRDLIRFRKEHGILHMPGELAGADTRACGYPDVSFHGERAWYCGYESSNRHIGMMYCGQYAKQEEFVYTAFNLYWDTNKLALPTLPQGLEWQIVLATDKTCGILNDREKPVKEKTAADKAAMPGTDATGRAAQRKDRSGLQIEMPGRSIAVLVSVRK